MAQAFGGFGIRVENDEDVAQALSAALKAIDDDNVFALIHLIVEQRVNAYKPPKSPADAQRFLASVPTGLLINGEWRPAASGKTFDVEDPATGKVLLSTAGAEDGKAALDAAAVAQESWAKVTRKIAPAVAAGCTVVLKPAKLTPLTSQLFAAVMQEAGLPDSVLNVIPSSRAGATTGSLIKDSRLRKLSFTGSTEVGRRLLTDAYETVLRTSMELGGNAPFVVFEDAELDAAVTVAGAMLAKLRNFEAARNLIPGGGRSASFGRSG